jgi:hypothetical protein
VDNFEQHIRDNRQALDGIEPIDKAKLWAGIAHQVDATATQKNAGWHLRIGRNWQWSIAASVAIVLSAWFFWPTPEPVVTDLTLANYFPELQEQEQSYRQLIAEKKAAMGFDQLPTEKYQETFRELQLLEELHTELVKDIPEFGQNERLMQALIKYYEHKIRILERLTKEIEKQERYEKFPREREI